MVFKKDLLYLIGSFTDRERDQKKDQTASLSSRQHFGRETIKTAHTAKRTCHLSHAFYTSSEQRLDAKWTRRLSAQPTEGAFTLHVTLKQRQQRLCEVPSTREQADPVQSVLTVGLNVAFKLQV